ncbi:MULTISPECIES: hypothetical protein [unclassified Bartonella]
MQCVKIGMWEVGMEGVGGKGLMAMNRLVIGFNGAVYRQFVVFCEFAKS